VTKVAAPLCISLFVISLSFVTYSSGISELPVILDKVIYGKPLDYWAQSFWQWTSTVPPDSETELDPSTNLNKCVIGFDPNQTMIFLMQAYESTFSTKCDIPAGKPILVPLLVGECDPTVPEPRVKSGKIEDLRECAKDSDEVFYSWDVALDGQTLFKKEGNTNVNIQLKDKILVRNSSLFTINIPENNNFEVAAGSYPAVVDGYYLVLKPLLPGEHTLTYKIVHQKENPGARFSYAQGDATYHLNVK
jgi:hypothetical protein